MTQLPKGRSFGPNKKGIRTTISYEIRDGQQVKITRKYKQSTTSRTVKKSILDRRSWVKFGAATGNPSGPDQCTTVGPEVTLNLLNGQNACAYEDMQERRIQEAIDRDPEIQALKKKLDIVRKTGITGIVCRFCKGSHFSAKCSNRGDNAIVASAESIISNTFSSLRRTGGKGTYRPPSSDRPGNSQRKQTSVRIGNLPDATDYQDIRDLVDCIGRVTRVHVVKNRYTGQSRGFAFVSFGSRKDAEKAVSRLNGLGYGHMILDVEFAKEKPRS